jgi:hypothetical protein
MFDRNNLVCRLFVAYMLEATHDQYSSDGCVWIANRFYDEVENYSGTGDAYQYAARRTPLGYAAFFINAERHFNLAEQNRSGQTGHLLFQAEQRAANTPVNFPLHVRKDEASGLWKMYKKVSRGVYELVPQYANMIGFSSKTKAEKCARSLEDIESEEAI